MVGITSYGAYVPLFRLGPETNGWNQRAEKAIASFDEDSMTMAVAAAIDCISGGDRQAIDGLFFASTTSPYKEKQAAATIATAIDLRKDILTADHANSLRAGTIALRSALDAVKAGSARQVMITASDLRVAKWGSGMEAVIGDGAAALIVGDSDVLVTIEDSYSVADELWDVWRADDDAYLRSWEDRFVFEEGYLRVMPEAVNSLMKRNGLLPKDFAKAIFYAPDARRHQEMARKLGFDPKTQLQDPLFATMGNAGTAFALMMLVSALEQAKAGDRILLANYGNGADAFLLRVTENIGKAKPQRGMKGHLSSKRILPDYQKYAVWRGLIDVEPPARRPPIEAPSASSLWRERDKNIRLHGVKCKQCGTPQYPPQRVCTICHAKDSFEPYRFSDKKATVFTYTMDYLGAAAELPSIFAMIDFDGGGRMIAEMTDRDIEQVGVGMAVEMSFRRLFSAEGIHNYYWKCVPLRD